MAFKARKTQKIQVLKDKIKNDPAITVCRCRAKTGYSVGIIPRYLKSELKLHFYKLQIYHQIKLEDFDKRVELRKPASPKAQTFSAK